MRGRPSHLVAVGTAVVAVALFAVVPLAGSSRIGEERPLAKGLLAHLSQGAVARYLLAHPEAREGVAAIKGQGASAASGARSGDSPEAAIRDLFNRDQLGLPQNEETVSACRKNPRYVVGGANDYRGLIDPQGNFSGWYFSTDGGRTVSKEGLLPAIPLNGEPIPSGGDPVVQNEDSCTFYFGSINYTLPTETEPFFGGRNSIALYKSDPATLSRCEGGREPDRLSTPGCWRGILVAHEALAPSGAGHFLDKEWLDVGRSGSAGKVVWLVWSDFVVDPDAPLGFTSASIKAARCKADLSSCTNPILISGAQADIQFADVTIARSGRVLITWAEIHGELEQTRQTFTIHARVAEPGSTSFGPDHLVAEEANPLPFGGRLHAEDFRTATYPKSIMPRLGNHERIYVTWDRCRAFIDALSACEEPEILLTHSDDLGATWSKPQPISIGGDNFFPAISDEISNPNFVIAYYTNRRDFFHHRYDVELLTLSASSGQVTKRQIVTPAPNEPDADPTLGGAFIGDYFDVDLLGTRVWVHYNANYRRVSVLGEGVPVAQQDNFLTITHR
jgi:hypothetical protein